MCLRWLARRSGSRWNVGTGAKLGKWEGERGWRLAHAIIIIRMIIISGRRQLFLSRDNAKPGHGDGGGDGDGANDDDGDRDRATYVGCSFHR